MVSAVNRLKSSSRMLNLVVFDYAPAVALKTENDTFINFCFRRRYGQNSLRYNHSCEYSSENIDIKCCESIPVISYNKFEDFKNFFQLNDTEVYNIIRKYPQLQKKSKASLTKAATLFMENGIPFEKIVQNPAMLLTRTTNFDTQIKRIRRFFPMEVSPSFLIPILRLGEPKLKFIGYLWRKERDMLAQNFQVTSRLEYLTKSFQVSELDVSIMISKMPKVATYNFKRVKSMVDVLLESQASSESILRDPYIFSYDPAHLRERLIELFQCGIKDIKPWMLRCEKLLYDSFLERTLMENKLFEEAQGREFFLMKRLGWTQPDVTDAFERVSQLKSVQLRKLDKMISLLLSNDITPAAIHAQPRILCFSVKKMEERLDELTPFTELPYMKNSLNRVRLMVLSERKFKRRVDKLCLEYLYPG